jgi:polyphenol oxidase
MVQCSYVRTMQILSAFPNADLVSGTTLVDTTDLPWPGASFGVTPSADADHVERSFVLLAHTLNVERSDIRSLHQVHGASVRTFAECSLSPDGDALITDRPGEVIGVKIADCCAILIHDPVHKVVAAVHSGWRGTAQRILTATVERLQREWGSSAEECSLYLSACASGAVYEVGADVFDQLSPFCTPLDQRSDKWLFDNHAALVHEAQELGVRRGSIIVEEACTIRDQRFHSYRRDGERSGRCFAFIGL